ncbi:restriction endonuclease subunit S [Aeromonas jandaei]|uniref:restriction endonuclease subunit S n=1 Tax=Aeromonas jandaei TaxID=650 RepID=UPI001C5ACBCE|nr:restriction endonuclease subunit S [Aeromonas jandaei]MBW3760334.1 restriction endonuclease subunit S [Aeromonas jandaei]
MAELMMQNQVGEMAAKQTIPTGYKQTEVGVIPEDWDIKELQQICRVPITYGIVQCGPHIVNGVPYIRVSDMTARELDIDGMQRTSPQIAAAFARSTVDEGDIVYALRGKLGFVRNVPSSVAGANLTQGTARISPVPNAFGRYIFWALQSPSSLEQATQGAKGSTFVEITLASLKEIKIPVPRHKEEQKVIADALSDIDELIAGLEQLIAKKQAIKTATMQQLLTGLTRLPAFAQRPDGTPKGYKSSELGQIPEDWDISSINKVGSIITGSTPPTAVACYWEGNIPWVTPTDIGDAKNIFESERRITEKGLQAIRGLPANSVLVTCIASIGKNAILKTAGACNQQINAIVPTALFDVDFLYYNIEFSKERLRQCAGITATPIISKALFSDFLLPFPSNKEQTAIATILSDMDSELQALEQKLAKARDVKQGMMQQLLTGRIRLPLPQEA